MTIPHEPRHPVENLDGVSDSRHWRVQGTWPEQQRPAISNGQKKLREIPATNPAELAGYAADGEADDSADPEQSYIDLGWAGDDEPDDDQIEVDAA